MCGGANQPRIHLKFAVMFLFFFYFTGFIETLYTKIIVLPLSFQNLHFFLLNACINYVSLQSNFREIMYLVFLINQIKEKMSHPFVFFILPIFVNCDTIAVLHIWF